MAIKRKSHGTFDINGVTSTQYNEAAGGQKNLQVGSFLKPIPLPNGTFTADASTRRYVGKGVSLYIYNDDVVAHSIVIGDVTIVTLAVGITDASGRVGVALQPGEYTMANTWLYDHIITDDAKVKVYIMEDHTDCN